MRKIALTLAVLLLATPALAAVRIIVEADDDCGAVIKYETDGEMVRAFALDVTIDSGQTIEAISDFLKGESTAAAPGFGIFPANFGDYIEVDADTGEVTTWDVNEYTPLADPNDPGALDGLGSSGVTIEMGALYYPADDTSPNAPPTSGTLCKLEVSGQCNVTVTENAIRGGVVLTDPDVAADVDLTLAQGVEVCTGTPCPSSWSQAECDEWITVGQPDCWLYPRQCHGDADGISEGKKKYWVSTKDLDILVAAWSKPFEQLVGDQICADFDHVTEGKKKYRVATKDLDILVANWNLNDAPAPDCPID
jgi:hypothetical protein